MKSLIVQIPHVLAACAVSLATAGLDLRAEEYRKGDSVKIVRRTELRDGSQVVGHAEPGERYAVEDVQDGWLLVRRNGIPGRVYKTDVRLANPMPDRQRVPRGAPEVLDPVAPQPPFGFGEPGTPRDLDARFEDRRGGPPIVIMAEKFFDLRGCSSWPGGLIIGGNDRGPHGAGGSASCTVDLPPSARKIMIGIHHGMPGEHGKGIHSRQHGGTVTVYINKVAVHTFQCIHRHMYNDFWPDPEAELGHDLPLIDLAEKGIKGPKLTIMFRASPWTCMDLRSIHVSFPLPEAGISGLVVSPQQFAPKTGHWFSQDMSAMIVNGGPPGPNDSGGATSCKVALAEGVDRVTIFINHGTHYGQGIHSIERGGTLKVSINRVLVHTFTCEHRPQGLKDYYPKPQPALTQEVPVNLRAKGISGRELTITFEASPRTCMDIQSVRIAPESGARPDDFSMPGLPVRERRESPLPPAPWPPEP